MYSNAKRFKIYNFKFAGRRPYYYDKSDDDTIVPSRVRIYIKMYK